MSLQDKAGIEKIVIKGGSDIELPGNVLATDDNIPFEKIMTNTAGGTMRKNGNDRVSTTIKCYDTSVASAIEAEEGNFNDVELWQLGSSSADKTIPGVNVIVEQEVLAADPEDEEGSHLVLNFTRIWRA